jgi:hypothetical protein
MLKKCEQLFKKAILPELVGKIYSRPLQEAAPSTSQQDNSISKKDHREIICICRAPYDKDKDNVIGCDNENCPYVWLHFKCAGVKRVPKGQWFCKECRD